MINLDIEGTVYGKEKGEKILIADDRSYTVVDVEKVIRELLKKGARAQLKEVVDRINIIENYAGSDHLYFRAEIISLRQALLKEVEDVSNTDK